MRCLVSKSKGNNRNKTRFSTTAKRTTLKMKEQTRYHKKNKTNKAIKQT